jgi:hypothetical protein
MNPPYPTTPVPGQGTYATPQHYPLQQQQQQLQQQQQQDQQRYQQGHFPVQTQGQMQPHAPPQTPTHLQPYHPPLPYQPACQDGADGGYYYDDDKYDSLHGYDKERERDGDWDMIKDKDKDKTKAERARDKHRALERRPTLGDSVMAAVERVGKVLGGQRR